MSDRSDLRARLRVEPGSKVRLAEFDPAETHGIAKPDAEAATARLHDRLSSSHQRLWAEHRHKVLIVLQGIDAAGKGGTIEHVMGLAVATIVADTLEDLAPAYPQPELPAGMVIT